MSSRLYSVAAASEACLESVVIPKILDETVQHVRYVLRRVSLFLFCVSCFFFFATATIEWPKIVSTHQVVRRRSPTGCSCRLESAKFTTVLGTCFGAYILEGQLQLKSATTNREDSNVFFCRFSFLLWRESNSVCTSHQTQIQENTPQRT